MKQGRTGEPSALAIAERAPIGIFRADAAGRITYINPSLETISGVPAERALGSSWLRSAPAESRERVENEWKAAVAAGENWQSEFQFNHPDGSTRYASILMTAEHDLKGKLSGFVGFVTDVSELRSEQKRLRKSDRLFRLLAENAIDIIVRLDLDDHITYASPAMGEITGFTAEETTGINPISAMHPDDAPAARELSRQLKAGEIEQAVIEYRALHKDGHVIWLEGRSRLVRDSRGEPREVIGVVRDISKRKMLEQELIAVREAERQASAAQSRFLATMSHEIRTPISGVIGMIDLLINAKSEEEQPRYRAALASSARTLLRVVDDVLDYSRLSSVGIALETRPFDMFATVHSVVDLYRPAAEAKGLTLGFQIQIVNRYVLGDATRLCQVLGNLVSNAIKFTDQGRIDIDVWQERDRWTFSVIDTGIGISDEQQQKLFHAFAQADETIAARFGGTGLGLAIAQLIVEAMGGSILVESGPGQGARFTFVALLEADTEQLAEGLEDNIQSDFRELDILVADDNEVNLLYLTKLLERMGHRVTAVTDGAAAVEAVRGGTFDAILMDRQMPRMDGEAAARAIREMQRDRPSLLVLVSAANSGAHGTGQRGQRGLFDATLPKPVHPEHLEAILATCSRSPEPSDPDLRSPFDEVRSLSTADTEELKRLFCLDLDERIATLQSGIETNDLIALRRQAHAIAGAAFLVGERAIGEIASSVETSATGQIVNGAMALHKACAEYLTVNSTS